MSQGTDKHMGQDERTPEQLIEYGVGLIAKGMFRMGSASKLGRPRDAHDSGMAAVSTIRGMALDFLRTAETKPIEPE